MPKTCWPSARGSPRQRSAQRTVRATDASARARSHGYGRHSSKTIAMSEPSVRCIAIDSFGPRKNSWPSRWELKRQPSSVNLRIRASEKTWKPPESVRIGPSQRMKRWSPPAAAITSGPGRSSRW